MTAAYCERVVAHTFAQLVLAARSEQIDEDKDAAEQALRGRT